MNIVLTLLLLAAAPPPEGDALKAAEQLVQEVYGERIVAAKTDRQKNALASEMLAAAEKEAGANRRALAAAVRKLATRPTLGVRAAILAAQPATDTLNTLRRADALWRRVQKSRQPRRYADAAELYASLTGADGLIAVKAKHRLKEIVKAAEGAERPIVFAQDLHEGGAGAPSRTTKNVYTLLAPTPIVVNQTCLVVRLDVFKATKDSGGQISISTDGKVWRPVSQWTREICLAAPANGNQATFSLQRAPARLKTARLLVRFDFTTGHDALMLYGVQWAHPRFQ